MGVSPRLLGLELYFATSLSSAPILVGAMNHYWSVGHHYCSAAREVLLAPGTTTALSPFVRRSYFATSHH